MDFNTSKKKEIHVFRCIINHFYVYILYIYRYTYYIYLKLYMILYLILSDSICRSGTILHVYSATNSLQSSCQYSSNGDVRHGHDKIRSGYQFRIKHLAYFQGFQNPTSIWGESTIFLALRYLIGI